MWPGSLCVRAGCRAPFCIQRGERPLSLTVARIERHLPVAVPRTLCSSTLQRCPWTLSLRLLTVCGFFCLQITPGGGICREGRVRRKRRQILARRSAQGWPSHEGGRTAASLAAHPPPPPPMSTLRTPTSTVASSSAGAAHATDCAAACVSTAPPPASPRPRLPCPTPATSRLVVGSLREYMGHDCAKTYVCVLYCSPCAPLLAPWLGELEGTSLAIA